MQEIAGEEETSSDEEKNSECEIADDDLERCNFHDDSDDSVEPQNTMSDNNVGKMRSYNRNIPSKIFLIFVDVSQPSKFGILYGIANNDIHFELILQTTLKSSTLRYKKQILGKC